VYLILTVQLSVVVFLLARGRKEKTFRQGFYLFFVAVTLLESFTVAVVSRRTSIVCEELALSLAKLRGRLYGKHFLISIWKRPCLSRERVLPKVFCKHRSGYEYSLYKRI
jgi:hypothetical protein